MRSLANATIPFALAIGLAGVIGVFIWQDLYELSLFPIILLLVYFAIYQTEKVFISIAKLF